MILSRLVKAVREQNWFAVALEFLIVILGVVIGFQVSLMGQHQAERAREADYLVRLDREFGAISDELEQAQGEVDAYFRRITWFLDGIQSGDPDLAQQGVWGLIGVTEVVSVNLQPAALSELISSGELGLISNGELRATLASIPQVQTDSHSRLEQMTQRLAPVAAAVSLRIDIDLDDITDLSSWTYTTETVQFDFDAIAQDPAFIRQLEYAGFQNRALASHLQRRQAALLEIREAVVAEVERRGLS
jgi:hypothetical protein